MATERKFKQISTALLGVSADFSRLLRSEGSPHVKPYDRLHQQLAEMVSLEEARIESIRRGRIEEQGRQEDEERKRRYTENRKKKEVLNVT